MTAEGTTTSKEQEQKLEQKSEQQCAKRRKLSVADDTNYWEFLKTRKHSQTVLDVIKNFGYECEPCFQFRAFRFHAGFYCNSYVVERPIHKYFTRLTVCGITSRESISANNATAEHLSANN